MWTYTVMPDGSVLIRNPDGQGTLLRSMELLASYLTTALNTRR